MKKNTPNIPRDTSSATTLAPTSEQDRRDREQAEDLCRGPAVLVALDEGVAQREERKARRDETRQVDALLVRRVARLLDDEERDDDADHADRDVDEEDPVPADVVHDEPADEGADRERESRDAGPDADRLAALPRRERRRDDRERRRVHQRRTDALHAAGTDQEAGVRREAARERGEREDREPDHEDLAAAVHVGELAPGDEQRREHERVAGDDPLQLRDRDLEVLADRRQGDVHDGVVEHDHEEAERDCCERPPLLVLLGEDPGFHISPFDCC
jgi:hypothetical protein